MEMEHGKLFIGGISWDTSEERLKEYFETYGEVVEAVIMKDRATGRARGFGFVVFANASVAEKVVKERHVIDGRTVEAKKAVPRDDHQNLSRNSGSIQGSPSPARTKKIFVGGLASSVTESDFKRYFEQFGTITDVVVMYDHNTQRPRGFGFITYNSEDAVDRVLFKTFHELNGKMVEVKRAVPKELSPGPARSQSPGYNYSLNRVSSFLNSYNQGYSSGSSSGYSMRMDNRFGPGTIGRSGYPPLSPSNYSMGLNTDSRLSMNYGPFGDLSLGYARGLNSDYSGNMNRSPIGYDVGVNGNGPLFNANQNLWGNGNFSYSTNTIASNNGNSLGSGTGNMGLVNNFGNVGDIWGSSTVSANGGENVSGSLRSMNLGYGIRGNIFGGRASYGGTNGGTGTASSTSSYSFPSNVRDGSSLGNLYGGAESFYGDYTWPSSSPELEPSTSFGYGGNAVTNMTSKGSVDYADDYTVNGRSNRGIAT